MNKFIRNVTRKIKSFLSKKKLCNIYFRGNKQSQTNIFKLRKYPNAYNIQNLEYI